MPCGDGRVRGEDAHISYAIDIQLFQPSRKTLVEPPRQKPQRQQRGMPFVHVKGFDLPRVNLLPKLKAAESQHDLLCQTIALVAAMKAICQRPVAITVLWQVRIQQINRNYIP